MLIGILKQFTNYYLPDLGDFVIVAILAVVLLARPQGLAGKVRA
jgi:branched-chain amino acid transport system permease protein